MEGSDTLIGQNVSHYRVIEKLGGGGMGVVYKAQDMRLGRYVALKFLPEKVARDSQALERFRREAKAASALNHANICTIYDIGEVKGRAFIAMEHLEGETLRRLIHRRRLETGQILDLAVQIASALRAAHAKGIIHRDIKPGNIFVSEGGWAKVLDFGLAKVSNKYLAEPEGMTAPTVDEADVELTMPRAVVGTVAYMSPEQVRGEKLDVRTDLFSFGAVLYEMATGRPAFPGNTSGIIFDAILNRAPLSASLVRPELSPGLHEIMNKAMEKDREFRYQHASDICADLKRLKRDAESGQVASGTGALAKTDLSSGKSASKWSAVFAWLGRRYFLSGAAFVSLLLIFGGLFFGLRNGDRPRFSGPPLPHQKNLVVLPFTAVDGQPDEQIYCDGFTETVTAKLAQVNSLQVAPALEVRTKHVASIQEARTQFGANLVLAASWQRLQNSARINVSLIDARSGKQLGAETITAPASDLLRLQDQVVLKASHILQLQLSPNDASSLTSHDTAIPTAYDFYVQGVGYLQRYERPENVKIAINMFRRAAEQDPSYAQAQAALAQAYWYKYSATKEPQWAEQAKRAVQAATKLSSQLPEVRMAIAEANLRTGSYGEAVSRFQQILETDPQNVDACLGLAKAYNLQGQTAEAEQAFRHAVQISPACWSCYNLLGAFLNGHARYGEAAEAWEKVAALTPDNAWGYMNAGAAYFNLGQFAKANEYFQRGLQVAPDNADLYSNAGTVSFFLGRFEEDLANCQKAIELRPQKYDYWGNLGDAYRMIPTESGKAAEAYKQAIRLAEVQLKLNPRDADVLSSLAIYYARINNAGRAREYLERALTLDPGNVDILCNAALIHLAAGDREKSLQWLEKAVTAGYTKEQLLANPEYSSLHSDVEFGQLVKRAKSYQ
jgi:serine/threonine protein kinase/tetratricopeptide (TPR) repeat protein